MPTTAKKDTSTQEAVQSDAWIAEEPGDTITGTIVEVDTGWSNWRAKQQPQNPNAGWYPLLTIETDDGTFRKLHGFRTVLFNELAKKRPVSGEKITVQYRGQGKDKGDGSNPPELYSVTVHGRGADADNNTYNRLFGQGVAPAPAPTNADSQVPADDEDIPF